MTQPTRESATELRVLVVDDNKDAADSLAVLLKLWGYDVHIVYDGSTAIGTAHSYRPDCILSDIGLPGIDGYRLAEQLRKDETFKETPMIAITAYSDQGRARAAGYDHHLVKPVNPEIVHDLIRSSTAMKNRLEQVEKATQKQGEVVTEVRDLMRGVKDDVKEMKEELKQDVKELKHGLQHVKVDVKEIKEELREAKKDSGKG